MNIERLQQIPVLAEYLNDADHVDVKTMSGTISMREFVAGVLSYQPGWMRALWGMRVWLLKLLGQGEHAVPVREHMSADTVPVKAGQKASFFTVGDSDGETYWIAVGEESHLGAALAVAVERADGETLKRFHLMTVVKYRSWAGPIYFNVIRLFHYLVVYAAMRSALQHKKIT